MTWLKGELSDSVVHSPETLERKIALQTQPIHTLKTPFAGVVLMLPPPFSYSYTVRCLHPLLPAPTKPPS